MDFSCALDGSLVVSKSCENSSRKENRELPCREQHTLPIPKSCFIISITNISLKEVDKSEADLQNEGKFWVASIHANTHPVK